MVPLIDIGPLVRNEREKALVARQIAGACRDIGFFYVVNHGVDAGLQRRLEDASRAFFALDLSRKMDVAMAKGGLAWRGYFPVGGELTSGKPDLKEGLYFGAELSASHPKVKAGVPLHGSNLFPAEPKELKPIVLEYVEAMTRLGHVLMRGLSLSLELEEDYFAKRYTSDPLVLFRIFGYPPAQPDGWGVGEHTDYGVLTILKQDDSGGLEVRGRKGWVAAPPVEGSFVCNIGDMLDRMTGGLYRSTPHRVRNASGCHRLSFPFFFDPNFDAEVKPIPLKHSVLDDKNERWDKTSVHEFRGTYGDYLLGKVSKVFPELRKKLLS